LTALSQVDDIYGSLVGLRFLTCGHYLLLPHWERLAEIQEIQLELLSEIGKR